MAKNEKAAQSEQPAAATGELAIQKIYVKDLSFETPHTPGIFQKEWQPEVKFELSSDSSSMEEENHHEVVLKITVTATIKDEVAFLVEVQQAGIFLVKDFGDEQKRYIFGSICPSILFPYARETIASSLSHGGFPQLNLAPINFDAVYAQHLQNQKEQTEKDADAKTVN